MYPRTRDPRNAAFSAEFYDKIRPAVTIGLSAYGVAQGGFGLSGPHNAVRRPGA